MAVALTTLVAHFLKSDDADWRLRLMREWATIVGGLHTKMRLEKIVHDTVVIGVYELHWMQELYMISAMIMQTINEKLGGQHVAKLRFVVADTQQRPFPARRALKKGDEVKVLPLTPQQEKTLEKINDTALRESLKKLWYRCQK